MIIFILEDDLFKREQITDFLNEHNIEYKSSKYARPALRDIIKDKDKISGIILDMGLQNSKESLESYSLFKGMDVIRELNRRGIKIPILINSSTRASQLEQYPFVYGQRKQIDDYLILENFISFLKQREEQ